MPDPDTDTDTDAAADVAPDPDRKKDELTSLAGKVPHLPTGDQAALRRMMLTGSRGAEGVVIGLLRRAGVPEAGWRSDTAFARWKLIAHVAAVLSGTGRIAPHAPGKRLGRALFAAGYSENRLMRLTSARGPALTDQMIRAARFLAQAGEAPVDLRPLHDLLSPSSEVTARARLRIARDYYSAQHAGEKDSQ